MPRARSPSLLLSVAHTLSVLDAFFSVMHEFIFTRSHFQCETLICKNMLVQTFFSPQPLFVTISERAPRCHFWVNKYKIIEIASNLIRFFFVHFYLIWMSPFFYCHNTLWRHIRCKHRFISARIHLSFPERPLCVTEFAKF